MIISMGVAHLCEVTPFQAVQKNKTGKTSLKNLRNRLIAYIFTINSYL
jgi:hypothetical protein